MPQITSPISSTTTLPIIQRGGNPPALEALLKHPQLWRAGELVDCPENNISTGYRSLDKLLWGGGWPRAGLMELLCDSPGLGELRLLMPALERLSQQQERWIAWINPPHIPYAPALSSLGIDISRVLLIHPRNHADALWALEQALKSGTCSAALAWLEEGKLKNSEIRRLQLAAAQGNTWATLFRPERAAESASMAELRLLATPDSIDSTPAATERLRLEITKRRGGWPVQSFSLNLKSSLTRCQASEFNQKLARWRKRNLKAPTSFEQSIEGKTGEHLSAAHLTGGHKSTKLSLLP